MNTQEFLDTIAEAPLKHLTFTQNGQQLVPDHYHITEVKQVTSRSVDCGGFPHNDEYIEVQLWLAKQEDDNHRINNADINKIVNIVQSKLDLNTTLPLFFEFSDDHHPTARYQVTGVHENNERIFFDLDIPKTVCKPRLTEAAACCAPGSDCC